MPSAGARILFIDSYDSFTYNLASLCREAVPGCEIHIIKNDQLSVKELTSILPYFAAVIVGPGPGSPDTTEDIGIVRQLWKISEDKLLPIFGVCLGLQSLAIEHGACLRRLNVVKHGQVSQIIHDGTGLFKGVGEANVVRYHSLHVVCQDLSDIEELAWADDGEENGRVVMAVKHSTKPFWAVQYHPESVCTTSGGLEVMRNFWRLAQNWSVVHGRSWRPWEDEICSMVGPTWPHVWSHTPPSSPHDPDRSDIPTSAIHLPDATVALVAELLGACDESTPFALLQSTSQPGRFSILASLTPDSTRITHIVGDVHVSVVRGNDVVREPLHTNDVWSWLASFMRPHKARQGALEIPFWGGLVGYLSYELGAETLSCPHPSTASARHPDVNLVFVERSVVIDHITGYVYIQSMKQGDDAWRNGTIERLVKATQKLSSEGSAPPSSAPLFAKPPVMSLPDKEYYKARIRQAQEHLFAGDSYELCLTAQTRIKTQPRKHSTSSSSSWDLYKLLQTRNPAPHAGYLRLHPTTFLSSSPERFLSYSRPPNAKCQLRPIKGTVRKGPGITRAVAEEALIGSAKEVAENLMIVDLIRHDLHGVVGENVEVKQFCRVEEYETVWQLVSVIEGQLPEGSVGPDAERELGWEVLRRSLPPGTNVSYSYLFSLLIMPVIFTGSMTGAPKKRSVEILQKLEGHERGIYSGVFGYWCVGGGGDWSVVIRSCFKHDGQSGDRPDCPETDPAEEWTIGAGGAITALSDPEAEWDEMVVKLESVLRTFESAAAT
ncbi:hypothetical protein EWM64_g2022 [Hericium alpestre]|uniref:aminodeoxychorismate synthase n=1 Tax=Hericium alpestre TaxID=135208 RepID=A0A4Z0A4N6_9AGAM|nr:hypothetical protein EWM64_g2022 [Hericium alpestre]